MAGIIGRNLLASSGISCLNKATCQPSKATSAKKSTATIPRHIPMAIPLVICFFSSHLHTGFLFYLFLVPVHAALFLYHRGMFVRFLQRIAGEKYRDKTGVILGEVIHTYFNYVKGMVLVYIIVGILNSIGLLALGIRHAILFGMMTAFMTIIPYVGIFISAALPVSVAFIISDSIWLPLGVVAVFSVVQYLEANVIFPAVVGTQLNVSTWATLVAIIAGGIIWGVSGMILFIPFVAILKIVTDHIKELDWLNILLNRDQS